MNGEKLFLEDHGQNVDKTLEPARNNSGLCIFLGQKRHGDSIQFFAFALLNISSKL